MDIRGRQARRRRAKIVCTLGPATEDEAQIARLMEAGMDVARINFSHGTQTQHARAIETIRRVAKRSSRAIAILQDLQGPKMRTGRLKGGQTVFLEEGQSFTITAEEVEGTSEIVSTSYPGLVRDVRVGDRVLLDDGLIELVVESKDRNSVHCRAVNGGPLGERKGINLPGVPISSPTFTRKDLDDLEFGIRHGVDYVALSFVRDPGDLEAVKGILAAHGLNTPVIAKIEKPEALQKLEGILEASNGVMVARGDLGVELPPEEVPMLQKHIIQEANQREKLVITATQMLESMMHSPRPTRAEASDVANAVLDGTDAVMLSGETAVGEYPIQATQMMARIVLEAEEHMHYEPAVRPDIHDSSYCISRAARQIAYENENVRAIAAFTRSGYTARLVSKERPSVPVIAFTPDERVFRQLALVWGVMPVLSEFVNSVEAMIALVEKALLEEGYVVPGDSVAIVAGMPIGSGSPTNFLKLQLVGGERRA